MITLPKESGTLPVGIEVDGKVHRDFIIRPRLVSDSVEAMEYPRAENNGAYRGLVLTALQIEKLGDLPQDKITPELLMSMLDIDMAEIMAVASRLEGRLLRFRDEPADQRPTPDSSGTGQDRSPVEGSA